MRLAETIQCGSLGIVAHPRRAYLVSRITMRCGCPTRIRGYLRAGCSEHLLGAVIHHVGHLQIVVTPLAIEPQLRDSVSILEPIRVYFTIIVEIRQRFSKASHCNPRRILVTNPLLET